MNVNVQTGKEILKNEIQIVIVHVFKHVLHEVAHFPEVIVRARNVLMGECECVEG